MTDEQFLKNVLVDLNQIEARDSLPLPKVIKQIKDRIAQGEDGRRRSAQTDLDALKLQRYIPVEDEDELLDALTEMYRLYNEGDPHPAKGVVKLIEKCPVRNDS